MALIKRVAPEKLTNFSAKVLAKVGVPSEEAMITAKKLVTTDIRGIDSHGTAHLRNYVNRLKEGKINAKPKIEFLDRNPNTIIVDGDNGLGFVVSHYAMMEAINRAQKAGFGTAAVRNSTHFGASSVYAIMPLEYDMIGVSISTGGIGMRIPGSTSTTGGVSPISIAVPAGKKAPFVLDMATTVVAEAKIEVARRLGRTMPEGWVTDTEGKPITDPNKFDLKLGGVLPLGGKPETGAYKGYALAVLVDIFANILSGGTEEMRRRAGSHFFSAIRVDNFLSVNEFKKKMDDMIGSIEALPTVPGVKKVYAAGGYEAEVVKDRTAHGIPIDEVWFNSLKELSEKFGVACNIEI